MLTQKQLKYFSSLKIKKFRDAENLFLAEGEKLVSEILHSGLKVQHLLASSDWIEKHGSAHTVWAEEISLRDLKKISTLSTPPGIVAVVQKPNHQFLPEKLENELSIFLDTVQDPGNLGTILRIADWFGINQVVCSPGCADVFNPKTIQASMGAICRVKTPTAEAKNLERLSAKMPVYGTFLSGENLYYTQTPAHGIVVMGNEAHGISPKTARWVSHKLFIPPYPAGAQRSESLNVAVATAIVCAEFRRKA